MAAPVQPVQFDYRDLGILNNPNFLNQYISENPLTATLKFASISRWPISAPWDHPNLVSMCAIYVEARYFVNAMVNPALKRAMIAGETLSLKFLI